MAELDIHRDIKDKLKTFIVEKKIPHIIFYGPSGSGKRYILRYFITNIYKTLNNIKRYVMYINCAITNNLINMFNITFILKLYQIKQRCITIACKDYY